MRARAFPSMTAHYRLVVRGELGDRFGLLFEGMRLERDHGTTVITGAVIDPVHLYGVIERIQGLGLELVSVNPVHDRGASDEPRHVHA
jgi:hypothetical protein